jgi:AraC-like DNA-binding protein
MFREAFARSWVLAIAAADGDGPASLLAIDRDHRIVGADHLARVEFGIRQTDIEGGLSLWSCFAPTGSLVSRRAGSPDAAVALRSSSNDQPRYALVSAPVMSSRSQISAGDAEFLLRPRNAALADVKRLISVEPTRGGLSAGALRRVCEYVEAHLEDAVGLDVLAAEANLSVFHFAREFRRSMGVAPHRYIFEQRVRRAQQLLATTELPIAAIATAAGFFDQGHLSRSFRQIVGVTPSAFRRSRQ